MVHPSRVLAASALALVTTIAPAAAADTATLTLTPDGDARRVEVREVVVRTDAAPSDARALILKRRATDGKESFRLELPGEDGEVRTLDLAGLELGETRSLQDEDGRWIDVTREEDGLLLEIDGEEIRLPHSKASELVSAPGAVLTLLDDANVHFIGDPVAGDAPFDGEHRIVMRKSAGPFAAAGTDHFEDLEALQGLSPEVRDATLAALKEIFSKPRIVTMDLDVGVEDDGSGEPTEDRKRRIRVLRLDGQDARWVEAR